jgi:Domain of unknown function (DUF4270)
MFSCSNQELSSFTPSDRLIQSNVSFTLIDTISYKSSTFKLDSIPTDIGKRILVGQYTDPHFGIVKCSGFINFEPISYDNIDEEAVFDSIVVNLPYEGYFYNDTLIQKKIKVYELNKEIRFRKGATNFYNTTDIPISTFLGERSFFPQISKDSIKITLNNNFGLNLFNKLKEGVISNSEDLKLFFKGIKIAPDDNENASIIGFNVDTSYLRFYYSLPNEPEVAKYIDFTYNNSLPENKYFSQIISDRKGTVFPDFRDQEDELKSSESNELNYIHSGVGIISKITFPNFRERILNLNRKGIIYDANLKIALDEKFISKNLYAGDSLQVFIVDQNNDIIERVTQKNGAQLFGFIKKESEFNETFINISIGDFLEKILSEDAYLNYGIILVPKDFNYATTRLILNSQNNSKSRSKLIITYLTYDK